MTIFNLGSINIDHVYSVPHLPAPGETLAATAHSTGLGGKGANQSVAAALAGAEVHHIGAIGTEGDWALQRLEYFGIDATSVPCLDVPTGNAIIYVDPQGENSIVIYPGANTALTESAIEDGLAGAGPGDILLIQNETSCQVFAARRGREKEMRVIYSAAPFNAAAVEAVLPHIDLLLLNAVEAEQLYQELGKSLEDLPVSGVVVTRGGRGAEWISAEEETIHAPIFSVTPVDTTGAGDCFAGSLAAALDAGESPSAAMRFAAGAAALQVTRPGTADAMPTRAEVDAFLETRP